MRIAALICLAALAACNRQEVSLSDNVETDLRFYSIFDGKTDRLHTPYVRGASIGLYADSGNADADPARWTFVSSAPSIFSVEQLTPEPDGALSATGVARASGTATLTVTDGAGRILASETVEVKVPDSARIEANGPLIIGAPEATATVTAPKLVANGTTTFLVRWFSGGDELAGNGVLQVSGADIDLRTETTAFLVQRDWLQVSARSAYGPRSIDVQADGAHIATLPVEIVDPSTISRIDLKGENESGVSSGTWLTVLAQAVDASGAPIFGVTYDFEVDGEAQDSPGDLYRYELERGVPKTLTASTGATQGSATIHAGEGYVDSANNIGCSSSGGPRGMLELFAMIGAVVVMRKRTAPAV